MERTPIVLPQSLQETLETIARNQDKTVLDLVQEVLNSYVANLQKTEPDLVRTDESKRPRRSPPPSIAGGGQTLGDLISPILEEDLTPSSFSRTWNNPEDAIYDNL